MKGMKAKIPRSIQTGTALKCADNTGARVLQVISVIGYRGVKRRYPKAGIGEMVVVTVKKGTPEMRKQILRAVIIRQKKEFRRPNGLRVKFDDNAAVLINDAREPRGTRIFGPVGRELREKRFMKIVSLASEVL